MSKRYLLPGHLGIIAAPSRRWAAYSVTFLSAIAPIVRPSADCPSVRLLGVLSLPADPALESERARASGSF